MLVYRIEREKYIDDTLKGIGASKQSLVVGIVSINEWFIQLKVYHSPV